MKTYFSVVHSITSHFADDFHQIFQLYTCEEGFVASNHPGTLYKFDDFDYADVSFEDFYFSVPHLINYF